MSTLSANDTEVGATLTPDNYYSKEADKKYLSVSQIKRFIGCPAKPGCEARAVAELNGEWETPKSEALTIGSYIDVQLTGTDKEKSEFVENHPEMFSSRGATKGELKTVYKAADLMIERAKKDADNGGIFMKTLEGKKQEALIGEIHGFKFKCKPDVLGEKFITDLKTTESITKRYYSNGWWNFINYWNYPLQGAVYQEIVFQNTGKKLPFYIAALSKEAEPDIGVFQIPQEDLDAALAEITPEVLERIVGLKEGKITPKRCEHCDYCRSTKVIKAPIDYNTLSGGNDNE